MPAALDGESESGFHRRRDWCGIEFSMLLFIPQNYRSNAAVRCIGHRSVLQRLMQCTALGIAAHCVFFVNLSVTCVKHITLITPLLEVGRRVASVCVTTPVRCTVGSGIDVIATRQVAVEHLWVGMETRQNGVLLSLEPNGRESQQEEGLYVESVLLSFCLYVIYRYNWVWCASIPSWDQTAERGTWSLECYAYIILLYSYCSYRQSRAKQLYKVIKPPYLTDQSHHLLAKLRFSPHNDIQLSCKE